MGDSPQGALTLRPHPGSRPGSAQRKQHGEGQAINTVNEVWNPVVGYEGLYEVSNLGRVRGLQRGKILKQRTDKDGYMRVTLFKEGKRKDKRAHRVVIQAFVGEHPEGMETRHLDGDRTNNNINNLQWGTSSENTMDTVKHGRHNHASKERCKYGHAKIPENTTAYGREEGKRICLACSRARAYRHDNPGLNATHQEVSDRYYRAITRGGG